MRRSAFLAIAVASGVACGTLSAPDDTTSAPDASADGSPEVDGSPPPPVGDAGADAAAACDLAKPFGLPVMVGGVNGGGQSYGARLTSDERSIYYASGVPTHLYFAERDPKIPGFTSVREIAGLEIGNSQDFPSPAGDVLFFAVGGLDPDIYAASIDGDGGAGSATNVTNVGPAGGIVEAPFATSSDLYFSRIVTGDLDIARAPRVGTTLGTVEAVNELNSSDNDTSPVLTRDQLTIYFRSDRSGAGDIFVAKRANVGAVFGAASPVMELNSPDTDGPSWISDDGCRIYISSSRNGSTPHIFVASR